MARFEDISIAFDDIIDTPLSRRRKVEQASADAELRMLRAGGPFAALASGIAGSLPGITENIRTTARDAGLSAFETPGEQLAGQLAQLDTTNYSGELAAADLLRSAGYPMRGNIVATAAGQNELARQQAELARQQAAMPQPVSASEIYQGQFITRDPLTGDIESINVTGDDYIDPTFRNQELGRIGVQARKYKTEAEEISDAYNKLKGLEAGMRAGNRSAINAAIMQTARLISPGVVTDADARAFAAAPTITEAVNNLIRNKNMPSLNQLTQIFDPTNPDVFDPDQLLFTANAAVTSKVPTLLNSFKNERKAAETYNAPQAFITANFVDQSQIAELEKIRKELGASTQTPLNVNFPTVNSRDEATKMLDENPDVSGVYFTDGDKTMKLERER
jgi:hypothetical protein